jgi:hypothetical protein
MWSQPTPTNARIRPGFATSLAPADWVLLVRLPSRVLAAVLAVPIDPPPVSAGLAGLATIAQARAAATVVVREVATAIFASVAPPVASGFSVADECVRAGFVLSQRVPSAEAEAYRRWVRQIGEAAVCAAGDEAVAAQISLLDDYERSLAA